MKELILSILEVFIQIFAPKENAKLQFYFVLHKETLKISELNIFNPIKQFSTIQSGCSECENALWYLLVKLLHHLKRFNT
ncbi:hypothetical protein ASG31_13400 [Chryseobacterium sp. Leaf404]|nr:hypothetical protein ASG31_13400 [Chryseobacterium sp. Leaf404]